jgi:hypothetical protein
LKPLLDFKDPFETPVRIVRSVFVETILKVLDRWLAPLSGAGYATARSPPPPLQPARVEAMRGALASQRRPLSLSFSLSAPGCAGLSAQRRPLSLSLRPGVRWPLSSASPSLSLSLSPPRGALASQRRHSLSLAALSFMQRRTRPRVVTCVWNFGWEMSSQRPFRDDARRFPSTRL